MARNDSLRKSFRDIADFQASHLGPRESAKWFLDNIVLDDTNINMRMMLPDPFQKFTRHLLFDPAKPDQHVLRRRSKNMSTEIHNNRNGDNKEESEWTSTDVDFVFEGIKNAFQAHAIAALHADIAQTHPRHAERFLNMSARYSLCGVYVHMCKNCGYTENDVQPIRYSTKREVQQVKAAMTSAVIELSAIIHPPPQTRKKRVSFRGNTAEIAADLYLAHVLDKLQAAEQGGRVRRVAASDVYREFVQFCLDNELDSHDCTPQDIGCFLGKLPFVQVGRAHHVSLYSFDTAKLAEYLARKKVLIYDPDEQNNK